MIICKKDNKYYVFMSNPKCGSTTLNSIVLKSLAKYIIHHGTKTFFDCNNNPNDINYNHCSLQGVIEYLKNSQINRNDVIIICIIRNPYERVVSNYFFHLKNKKINYINSTDRNEDIKIFLNQPELRQYQKPNYFRKYLDYNIDIIFRLENLEADIEDFNKKFDINLKYNKCKLNKNNNKPNIILSDEVKQLIYNDFKIDFIEGHYIQ